MNTGRPVVWWEQHNGHPQILSHALVRLREE